MSTAAKQAVYQHQFIHSPANRRDRFWDHILLAIQQAHMWVKPLAYVLADSRGFHRRRQNALKLAQLLEFRRAGQRKATQPWAQAAHAVETDTEGLHLDTVARLLRSAQQFVRYDPMVTQPVKRDVQMLRRYLTSGQATGVHPPLRRIDRH